LPNKYFSAAYNESNFYTANCFSENRNSSDSTTEAPQNPTDKLRILMIGDVVGRCGRRVLKTVIPNLKKNFNIDFITVNAENIAGGFGITEKTYLEMNALGIDAFTMGNHWQDKPDIHRIWKKYPNIVLPQNLIDVPDVEKVPSFFCTSKNKTIHIINLMGTFAMKAEYKRPFEFLMREKENFTALKANGDIIIADIHAEGNSEKQSIAWFYDGICAALIGTHTHTSTSDERILTNGTAFITDVGMTGAYNSVTGMNKERILQRMCFPDQKKAFEVSEKEPWFCGFLVDIDLNTSLATSCARLQCRMDDNRGSQAWIVSKISV